MSEFSDKLEELTKKQRDLENARKKKKSHPEGTEEGISWSDKTKRGTVTIQSNVKPDDDIWNKHLLEWGFDPEYFEVVNDTVQYRAWDTNMGDGEVQRMHYYKADIVRKGQNPYYDTTPLVNLIQKHKFKKNTEKGDHAFILALSDWQLGKEDGDGVEGVTERVLLGIDQSVARVKALRKQGVKFNKCVIACLGDLVEGCDGFYAMQTWSVQLNQRDQIQLGTNLLLKVIEAMAPLFKEVICVSVGGNHGENRGNKNKAYTDFADNYDLVIADNVARVVSSNKSSFGHVKFVIPEKELAVTLDVNGKIMAFAHGHQFRTGGGNAGAKAFAWLKGQALAGLPAGDCDILLSAHFHHESVLSEYGRTHVQTPALDGGSLWIENTHGLTSQPGITTFTINKDGMHNYQILKR